MPWSNDIHKKKYHKQAEFIIEAISSEFPEDVIKFMIGGLFVRTDITRDCVSKKAHAMLKNFFKRKNLPSPYEVPNGTIKYTRLREFSKVKNACLRCEHPFPINVVYNRFMALAAKKALNAERLAKLIEDKFKCCFITQDEDKELTRVGCRSKLPQEYDMLSLEEIPIDCRYKKAKIEF